VGQFERGRPENLVEHVVSRCNMISGEERETFLDLYNNYRDSRGQTKSMGMEDGGFQFGGGVIEPDISALNTLAEVSRRHGHLAPTHTASNGKQRKPFSRPFPNGDNGFATGTLPPQF
jgi:hypothetical protein